MAGARVYPRRGVALVVMVATVGVAVVARYVLNEPIFARRTSRRWRSWS